MELPEEILAHIFSFLCISDKCNAFAVCKTWSRTMRYPGAWTHTEISCGSGTQFPERFSELLPLVKHLKLCVGVTEPTNRETALWVIRHAFAEGDGRLRILCVRCFGNPPLFYAGQDLMKGLVDILKFGPSLTTLDLKGVPFTLKDDFIESIAAISPALQSLFINNNSLVCGVKPGTMMKVLKHCPVLNTIGLFLASLSQDVIKDLLLPGRPPLKQLELRCDRSVKYVPPLRDQIWVELRKRHPNMSVDLELDHTLPELQVPGVLLPSIPVRKLHLHTWTWLLDEVRQVGQSYANTLESLELQTIPSHELNLALINLAMQCRKLREVHCYCVVSAEVIHAFCTHCANLQKYTLKTHKEPHPWECTRLR